MQITGVGITAALGVLSVGGFFGAYAYLLNLASHFRLQYTIISLAGSIILLSLGRRKFSLLLLGIALLNVIEIVPLYQKPARRTGSVQANFSLLQANVLSENQQHQRLIHEVRRLNPNIVVLEEVTQAWYEALQPLREEYPYVIHTLDRSNLGVMVMSNVTLHETELIDFDDDRLPSLITELQVNGHVIDLIATHPPSPRNRKRFKLRNAQLYALARKFSHHPNPLMMVGDLNITSFSPVFDRFIRQVDLYDSRQGYGVQPSWPARYWLPARIALDHCLLSSSLRVKKRELLSSIGSDHLPVYLVVELMGDSENKLAY